MSESRPDDRFVNVGSVEEAKEAAPHVLSIDGTAIGLFYHEGTFYATDLRCPHMGFPLTEGTVEDGILTCHWHHARFELARGDTLDPFADDVPTYPVEVRDGEVFVNPEPVQDQEPEHHWRQRLEHGLQEDLSLIVAKAVIGLDNAGLEPAVPLGIGVDFGTQYREAGWGRGLTTLGVMANLLPYLRPEDRRRALYVGLREVTDECAGEPPFFAQEALSNTEVPPARLASWFRENIEVRDADGAERVLLAAIRGELPQDRLAGMFVGAATDHLYLDTGHRLDFINKAFDVLDHVGWAFADRVLPSLVPGLAGAERAEERSSWRQPIDVAQLCFDAAEELPDLVEAGEGRTWSQPDAFVGTLLGDDPYEIMGGITDAIANGAAAEQLASPLATAAARRIAQFGTSNEFNDWNTVHHTYTYVNAVHGLAGRTDDPVVYRGIFDGAMNVYLDRFLNTPPQPVPDPVGDREPTAVLDDLEETFDREDDREVNRAGRLTAEYLAADGDIAGLQRTLGRILLREDVGFHPRQNLDAAFNQYRHADERAEGAIHLVATARYLAAHTPTRRAGEQTFTIAERLSRGEKIHE